MPYNNSSNESSNDRAMDILDKNSMYEESRLDGFCLEHFVSFVVHNLSYYDHIRSAY
jgi:hypothetical protein